MYPNLMLALSKLTRFLKVLEIPVRSLANTSYLITYVVVHMLRNVGLNRSNFRTVVKV